MAIKVRFHWFKAPASAELTVLTQQMAPRIGRFLERQCLLERDSENSYLAWAVLLLPDNLTSPQLGRFG